MGGWAYAELDGNGEVVTAGLFGDDIASFDTWEVDEGRLDDAAFALGGFQQAFGEPAISALGPMGSGDQCHRKPAYAMERVADPAPSLALTTSSPPN
jgi:hypothetical protein